MKYHKAARNALWLMGGRVTNKILVFLTGLLVARHLGPEQYGILGYAGAWLTFFAALCNLGLDAVLVKNFVDHPHEEGRTLGTALLLRGISALLSAGIMTALVALMDRQEPMTVAVAAISSLSLIPQVFDSLKKWFQSRLQSQYAALAAILSCAGASIFRIALILSDANLLWFALATTVEYAFLALSLLISYKKQGGQPLSVSRKKAAQLLRSGSGFLLSGMMVSIYASTDKLMLGQLMDKDSVACYTLAVSLCAVWGFVLEAVIESLHPGIMQLHSKSRAAFDRRNRQLYAITFYGALAMSLVTCLVAEPLVRLLYGEEYAPAVAPLQIVVWYTAFSYLGGARNAWVVCENAQNHLKYLYAAAALLNVALNALLIPDFGASGAAVASLVTQIATTVLLPWLIPALRPNARLMLDAIRLHDIFPRRE